MAKMEPTFYEDPMSANNNGHHHHHHHPHSGKEDVNLLKRRMTLDLNSSKPPALKKQKFNPVLSSPDLNMLKLASPELEKMIIQHNGMVTTTPTPTQFLFPKMVTEEQEQYARGFVDALAQMHQTDSSSSSTSSLQDSNNTSTTPTSLLPDNPIYTTLESNVPISVSGGVQHLPPVTTSANYFAGVSIKDEPQTVPNLGSSPPLSPIDMESQEKIKLERKRQRNRIAASKCRRRKLERIAKLEDRVKHLRGENSELSGVKNKLKDDVCTLKQEMMEHVQCGCQILLTTQFAAC